MQWNSRSYKIMSFNSVLIETSCINGEFIKKKISNVNQLILPEYCRVECETRTCVGRTISATHIIITI